MKTYEITETYKVQASSAAAAREAVLIDSSTGEEKKDYCLFLEEENKSNYMLVFTEKEYWEKDGKKVYDCVDRAFHYSDLGEALHEYKECLDDEDAWSVSLATVIQSTDYGVGGSIE